jgi:hypothetical protein
MLDDHIVYSSLEAGFILFFSVMYVIVRYSYANLCVWVIIFNCCYF